jgi:hypothetical protein
MAAWLTAVVVLTVAAVLAAMMTGAWLALTYARRRDDAGCGGPRP